MFGGCKLFRTWDAVWQAWTANQLFVFAIWCSSYTQRQCACSVIICFLFAIQIAWFTSACKFWEFWEEKTDRPCWISDTADFRCAVMWMSTFYSQYALSCWRVFYISRLAPKGWKRAFCQHGVLAEISRKRSRLSENLVMVQTYIDCVHVLLTGFRALQCKLFWCLKPYTKSSRFSISFSRLQWCCLHSLYGQKISQFNVQNLL